MNSWRARLPQKLKVSVYTPCNQWMHSRLKYKKVQFREKEDALFSVHRAWEDVFFKIHKNSQRHFSVNSNGVVVYMHVGIENLIEK